CPDGQKCTVLGSGNQPVYDCVEDDGSKLPFEPCTPEPSTGQDQCPAGFACIPSEPGGGNGLCLELCLADNDCEASLCVAYPGEVVPVCAPICNPLGPLCPEQQGCYRVRNSAFVCRYTGMNDFGVTAEPCDIVDDSGCAQGFVCETGQIIPGCAGESCCTALCDLSDADPCMAPMSCGELPLDPLPVFDSVGACYVPQ
ncbi:MAG: hypothetical protein KC431_04375, partial [Myxococcales bacterium]|nr:hypothetical protein [Myxococcales bacterium]